MGRSSRIPNAGDYFTLTVVDEPLIVVRDKDGAARVLSAVCQHRAMVVAEDAGTCSKFTCPYHLWTYALDGRLLGAPAMERAEGFDKRDFALPPLPVEERQGFIFTSFDRDAPPITPTLTKVNMYAQSSDLENAEFTEWDDADNAIVRTNRFTHIDAGFNAKLIRPPILNRLRPSALGNRGRDDGVLALADAVSHVGPPCVSLLPFRRRCGCGNVARCNWAFVAAQTSTHSRLGGGRSSGGCAIRTSTPVDDLGFVDLVTAIICRCQARGGTYGAVNVGRTAANAADDVVVVVSHAILVAGRRSGGLDAPENALLGEGAEGVVNRLPRDGAYLGADDPLDLVRRAVRGLGHRPQHGKPLSRHLQAVPSQNRVAVRP